MTTEELKELAATLNAGNHAGTVEDPIPQQLLYTKTAEDGTKKVYTVAAGIAVSGGTGSASPATDTVMGIVKLTDDASVDAPAATGHTAITPNGVKTIVDTSLKEMSEIVKQAIADGSIDEALGTAIEDAINSGALDDVIQGALGGDAIKDAIQDAIDSGKLDEALGGAIQDAVDSGVMDGIIQDAIQDAIESGEITGGGEGGSSSIVLKPGLIAPLEGAQNVSVMVQLQASDYKCLLPDEPRKEREFVIATVSEPSSNVFVKRVNANTVSVDTQLNPQTQYKWRCRDVTVNGLSSAWTSWTTFTTGNAISVDTPTVEVQGGTTDVLETPTFTASAFAITPDQGDTASQHQSTTWRLLSVDDSNAQVWISENDTTNKTSITLARGTLQANKTYIMQVTYNSVSYGSSSAGSVQFTTATEFTHIATPTITITGGAVNVGETPVFNGSAFTVEPSGSDTHVASTWVVTKKPDNSEIYRLDRNAVQKTTLTLPGSLLAEGQSYTVSLVYHGQTYGDSAAGTLDFSCAETFKGIKAPTLSLQGANDDGLVDYAASYVASQFEYIGGEDTCDKVDWELYKGDAKVWSAANSTILRYLGSFGDYTLEPSTAYVLKYRQHAKTNDVWSAWAELNFTTVSEFTAPTLKFKLTQPNTVLGASAYINLNDLFLWWDSSKFHVYKDGALDASLTSNIDQSWIVGDVDNDIGRYGDTIIEIKRIDGQNKYPYLCFNGVRENKNYFKSAGGMVQPGNGYLTLEILSPLPTLYSAEEGEPVKEFAGGYAEGVIGGPFYDCARLTSLPDNLFKFNPQITILGGFGGGGGGSAQGNGNEGGNGGGGERSATDGGAGGDGYGCFTNCSGLTSLPDTLFAYCPNIVNLGGIGGGGGGDGEDGGDNDGSGGAGGMGGNIKGGQGGEGTWSGGKNGSSSYDVAVPQNNTIPESAKGIFAGCTKLTTVPQNLLRNFGTTNDVVGANLIGTFDGCTKLNATVYFDATGIAQGCVKNFAKGCAAPATVFAKSASTTYNSFHDETTANCNVIPF